MVEENPREPTSPQSFLAVLAASSGEDSLARPAIRSDQVQSKLLHHRRVSCWLQPMRQANLQQAHAFRSSLTRRAMDMDEATTDSAGATASLKREQAFWDEHVPSFDEWRHQYETPPDANTAAMLDAVEPLDGRTVVDFACGGGVTSAWLAARGAKVTGLDISPVSVRAAAEYCQAVGLDASFVAADLASADLPVDCFDRIIGR
jgi:2-polyprenyl-3-methyl-5-hydroxy-6-metoxy-1,4-benzoquinol methylase